MLVTMMELPKPEVAGVPEVQEQRSFSYPVQISVRTLDDHPGAAPPPPPPLAPADSDY